MGYCWLVVVVLAAMWRFYYQFRIVDWSRALVLKRLDGHVTSTAAFHLFDLPSAYGVRDLETPAHNAKKERRLIERGHTMISVLWAVVP